MSLYTSRNKKIAKNTIYLYFRTILIMFVALYTSRVVLQTLGITDYGIYTAVGGFVAMFSMISGALTNAISRYITYELGKNDRNKLNLIFCTSVNIQIIMACLILLLCEFLGVWFLNHKMNIPADRIIAANWVFQCSILTFVINLISVPYNACIIAHENMQVYAYISILDAILKLSVVYLLLISSIDKLVLYSVLLVLVSLIIRFIYSLYCGRFYSETKYSLKYDKKVFNDMIRFAGWNFFTNTTSILNSQGVNLLINIFFGVALNTALGIATQVQAAINQFVNSFTTALNPQITISYAQRDLERMHSLICKGSKFSYFLFLLFALPIIAEAPLLLKIWLGQVPEYTIVFVRLAIISSMVNILGNTPYTACMATGKIKRYAIWVTIVGSLVFFLTILAYKMGMPPETSYWIYVFVYTIVLLVKLILMRQMLFLKIRDFVIAVLLRVLPVSILSFAIIIIFISYTDVSLLRGCVTLFLSIVIWLFSVYIIGLTNKERTIVKAKLQSKLCKIHQDRL